ncbi:MAG: ASKHA domain-containing protein [Treponema sp.]|jgi:uncharacterized 2Fe-2S/4Fe-4S cluster protein (DUF4445 family)|nr:ASKHA domain-containing protein [Treponema sp.]
MIVRIEGRDGFCEAAEGESLLDVLKRWGVSIDAPCGGRRRCGKCLVQVLSGTCRGEGPSGLLPDSEKGWVRSCAVYPASDLLLALPRRDFFSADSPSASGGGRVARAGLALDVGTTTVCLRLVDLDTGRGLDTFSALNDQRIYGADVMSRIGAAREGKTGELFSRINTQTADLLSLVAKKWKVEKFEELSVAGNTTMLHLFANTDPSAMGAVPCTPAFLEARTFPGSALSLPAETVKLLPSISAFVGADITAGIAVTGMTEGDASSLLVDIGTNGEMALFHRGKLFCCSTAAGPAFEGAGISCGTGSIRGAINRVRKEEGRIVFSLIGQEEGAEIAPAGICGSGLVDAVALMLEEGVVDETGAFTSEDAESFPIAEGIALTKADVRQFQLAKSAILSGIKILCKTAGLEPSDLERVYIAGGLGFHIGMDSAVRTGLLPSCFRDRASVCGNTSLEGASRCLSDPGFFSRCNGISAISGTVELAADPAFMDEFSENMLFPEE